MARAEPPVELDPARVQELIELGAIRELAALFHATTATAAPDLAAALTAHDAPAVRRIAHGLCGSAANIGATMLADLYATIEQHAMHGDLTPVFDLAASAAERQARTRSELDALAGPT